MAFTGGQPASLGELETRLGTAETDAANASAAAATASADAAAALAAAATAKSTHYGEGAPAGALGKDDDLYMDIGGPASTGLIYAKVGGVWVSTGFQAWKA